MALYPAVLQVNGDVATQLGVGLAASYYVSEGMALQVRFGHRVHLYETELGGLTRTHPQQEMPSLQGSHRWSLLGGPELHPLLGEATVLGAPVRVSGFLGGHAGIVAREHWFYRLGERFFFDTGLPFGAGYTVGARLRIGDRFSLRAELSDLWTSGVTRRVSGCSEQDLSAMGRTMAQGQPLRSALVSNRCDVDWMEANQELVGVALSHTRDVSSPLLRTMSVQLGAAFVF